MGTSGGPWGISGDPTDLGDGMGTSGGLGDIWGPWGPLGTFGDIWGPHGPWGQRGDLGDLRGPLGTSRSIWGPPRTWGTAWGHVGTLGTAWGFWRWEKPFGGGTRRGQSEGPKGRGGDIPVCAQIVVTVWQRDSEPAELQEGGGFGGYLGLLQGRAPSHVFRQEQGAFKAQGINSPPPPPAPPCCPFVTLNTPLPPPPRSPLSP